MRNKFRQCVCCGFNALRGSTHYVVASNVATRTKAVFVCAACELENIEEDERRYEDESELEVERLGKRERF